MKISHFHMRLHTHIHLSLCTPACACKSRIFSDFCNCNKKAYLRVCIPQMCKNCSDSAKYKSLMYFFLQFENYIGSWRMDTDLKYMFTTSNVSRKFVRDCFPRSSQLYDTYRKKVNEI